MAKSDLPAERDARALSSNVNLGYLRTGFMDNVANRLRDQLDLSQEPDHRYNKEWIDPLHPVYRKLRRLPKETMATVRYNGTQKLTTLAHEHYGTTSLWYVVLYVSGFAHEHEIPSGALLYFPQMKDLNALLQILPQSKRGTVVRT